MKTIFEYSIICRDERRRWLSSTGNLSEDSGLLANTPGKSNLLCAAWSCVA